MSTVNYFTITSTAKAFTTYGELFGIICLSWKKLLETDCFVQGIFFFWNITSKKCAKLNFVTYSVLGESFCEIPSYKQTKFFWLFTLWAQYLLVKKIRSRMQSYLPIFSTLSYMFHRVRHFLVIREKFTTVSIYCISKFTIMLAEKQSELLLKLNSN